jgi:hypothetical protein
MATAESRVARLLGINEAEARSFIGRVRALLPMPPNDVWIARCLEEYPDIPHTPEAVVVKMKVLGWVTHPAKKSGTPRRKQTGRASGRTKTGNRPGAEARGARPSRRRRIGFSQPYQGPPTWNDPTDADAKPLDPSRVPLRRLTRCPHGVPRTDVCAICEPDWFERLGDVD